LGIEKGLPRLEVRKGVREHALGVIQDFISGTKRRMNLIEMVKEKRKKKKKKKNQKRTFTSLIKKNKKKKGFRAQKGTTRGVLEG